MNEGFHLLPQTDSLLYLTDANNIDMSRSMPMQSVSVFDRENKKKSFVHLFNSNGMF